MSLGEWIIVSLLLLSRFGLGWQYWASMVFIFMLTVLLKITGVME